MGSTERGKRGLRRAWKEAAHCANTTSTSPSLEAHRPARDALHSTSPSRGQRSAAARRSTVWHDSWAPPRGCPGVPLKAPRRDRVMVLSAKVPNMTLSATRACCDGQSNLQPQRPLTCGACRRQCVCGMLPAIRRIRALRDVVHAYLVARRVRHQALHAYELGAVRRDERHGPSRDRLRVHRDGQPGAREDFSPPHLLPPCYLNHHELIR